MAMALRRLAGASGSPSAAARQLRPALTRPISTGFREERVSFGAIRVPDNKYVVVLLGYRIHGSVGFVAPS
jgi:fumarate hydratase class II